jgi:hypothetical protein
MSSNLQAPPGDWLEAILLGEEDHSPGTGEDPDREMRIAVEIPIAQLLAEYESSCARYRELVVVQGKMRQRMPFGPRPGEMRACSPHPA